MTAVRWPSRYRAIRRLPEIRSDLTIDLPRVVDTGLGGLAFCLFGGDIPEGRIIVDAAFFDKMSNQWREEQNRCQREIDRHQSAEQTYMDEGVQILELARNAHMRLFRSRAPISRLS